MGFLMKIGVISILFIPFFFTSATDTKESGILQKRPSAAVRVQSLLSLPATEPQRGETLLYVAGNRNVRRSIFQLSEENCAAFESISRCITENTGPERLATSCQNVAFAFLTSYYRMYLPLTTRCLSEQMLLKMYDLCCLRYTIDNLFKCKEDLLFSVCCDEASPTPEANTTAASVQIWSLLQCIS